MSLRPYQRLLAERAEREQREKMLRKQEYGRRYRWDDGGAAQSLAEFTGNEEQNELGDKAASTIQKHLRGKLKRREQVVVSTDTPKENPGRRRQFEPMVVALDVNEAGGKGREIGRDVVGSGAGAGAGGDRGGDGMAGMEDDGGDDDPSLFESVNLGSNKKQSLFREGSRPPSPNFRGASDAGDQGGDEETQREQQDGGGELEQPPPAEKEEEEDEMQGQGGQGGSLEQPPEEETQGQQ